MNTCKKFCHIYIDADCLLETSRSAKTHLQPKSIELDLNMLCLQHCNPFFEEKKIVYLNFYIYFHHTRNIRSVEIMTVFRKDAYVPSLKVDAVSATMSSSSHLYS